jgi:hypothetical protein
VILEPDRRQVGLAEGHPGDREASPGSLLPGRRLRPRSRRLRCGGTSRTVDPAAMRWRATGAPYEAEPSIPILTSGAKP